MSGTAQSYVQGHRRSSPALTYDGNRFHLRYLKHSDRRSKNSGLMSRQLSYQRSSLLKRSQRTSELAEITPKATLLLLLVLQVTQVELPGQAGLQLTLQEAFTEQLCYFQPRGESSASCRDASIATRRSFSHPTLLHPVAFHLSFCSRSKSVLITWLFHTTL